jgi:hypothetical protein
MQKIYMGSPAAAHAGNPRLRHVDLFNPPQSPYKSITYSMVQAAGHE